MNEDRSCWTCGYLGNHRGVNFVQDFTCNWFLENRKEEPKKLYPKKDIDEGCKFWKMRDSN